MTGLFPEIFLTHAVDHPLPFHGDQCGCLSEWHPDLKNSLFARLIPLLLGKEVDPVMIAHFKPPLPFSRHPDIPVSNRSIACLIKTFGLKNHISRNGRLGIADQKASGICLSFAEGSNLLCLRRMLVGIQSSDKTLSMGQRSCL